jgi:RimJ/RimL family protein N-acetyltransferase
MIMSAGRPVLLTGEGLVLREWAENDIQAMVELFDDPDIAKRTPLPSPFTLDEARDRLAKAKQSDRLLLAVTTDGQRPLGEVLLIAPGELGYMIGARHRGAGLAARALVLLRDHAHQALGLPVLRLKIEPDNVASAEVARRAGFRLKEEGAEVVENKGRRCILDVWEHGQPGAGGPAS